MPTSRSLTKTEALSAEKTSVGELSTSTTSNVRSQGPGRGMVLPLGTWDLFTSAPGGSAPNAPSGRVHVQAEPDGRTLRETWVMFSNYVAPGPRADLIIRPRAGQLQDLRSFRTQLAQVNNAIESTWLLPDPRAPGSLPRQIDAGTVEIVASGPLIPGGSVRIGTVKVMPPGGFVGTWSTSSVVGRGTWGEEWHVLIAVPSFAELRLRAGDPVALQTWINQDSSRLAVGLWAASYQSFAV